ncbi:Ankyrin repeats containing protein [Cardinium endosymbiont of Sogatella furcifera]|uniref:ankyrin repeat domain-containing protein n=1 Tax=Cardinium endosymbiont of Sogatella furcifera TaxID=650378 RepID=UPI000E0CE4EC|nr:ankyrin repeat domain-containing protein [Cardinium endosymbiont of Sogatella furcifera]AXI23857.1 Ankyrin repeats containing protein [Cardinium endosymbiont of Sogatella furcifera]
MKIIYNIQYAILRSIFYFSIVFSGCTSFRHHMEPGHEARSVSPCRDLCGRKIVELVLDRISENSIYLRFCKSFKHLIQKSESRQMKYPLHMLVKYFKQVQKYFDSLALPPYFKDKCISSFIAAYAADINVLKPPGNLFSSDMYLFPCSPLCLEIKKEEPSPRLVHLLLQHGADPNLRDDIQFTPFHNVVENGRIGLIQLLLDAGADPNLRDGYDWLPLFVAIEKKNLKSMQLLLDAGADPNLPDSKGNTPLHLATKNHYLAGIQLLISHGANVNQPNYKGSTSLHIAALSCRKGIWDFLCTQGSDMYRVNHAGHTPLYLQATRQVDIGLRIVMIGLFPLTLFVL